jgi:hypothetical protein
MISINNILVDRTLDNIKFVNYLLYHPRTQRIIRKIGRHNTPFEHILNLMVCNNHIGMIKHLLSLPETNIDRYHSYVDLGVLINTFVYRETNEKMKYIFNILLRHGTAKYCLYLYIQYMVINLEYKCATKALYQNIDVSLYEMPW